MVSHDQPRTTLVLRLLGQGSLLHCLYLMMGLRFLIQEAVRTGGAGTGKTYENSKAFQPWSGLQFRPALMLSYFLAPLEG